MPGPDVKPMYKKYLTHTYKLAQNIVCACCGCIYHDITEFEVVPQSYGPLRYLRIPEDVNIPFQGLTWIEELLIARVHVCGNIVRLGQRNNPSSFFGIKGHVVFLPQDTTRLIDLLPMSPASLSGIVKVVWTGRSKPNKSNLRSRFTVRKNKVYNALK
jgi:hypothetical protein